MHAYTCIPRSKSYTIDSVHRNQVEVSGKSQDATLNSPCEFFRFLFTSQTAWWDTVLGLKLIGYVGFKSCNVKRQNWCEDKSQNLWCNSWYWNVRNKAIWQWIGSLWKKKTTGNDTGFPRYRRGGYDTMSTWSSPKAWWPQAMSEPCPLPHCHILRATDPTTFGKSQTLRRSWKCWSVCQIPPELASHPASKCGTRWTQQKSFNYSFIQIQISDQLHLDIEPCPQPRFKPGRVNEYGQAQPHNFTCSSLFIPTETPCQHHKWQVICFCSFKSCMVHCRSWVANSWTKWSSPKNEASQSRGAEHESNINKHWLLIVEQEEVEEDRNFGMISTSRCKIALPQTCIEPLSPPRVQK